MLARGLFLRSGTRPGRRRALPARVQRVRNIQESKHKEFSAPNKQVHENNREGVNSTRRPAFYNNECSVGEQDIIKLTHLAKTDCN
jgi:hypothetical protein